MDINCICLNNVDYISMLNKIKMKDGFEINTYMSFLSKGYVGFYKNIKFFLNTSISSHRFKLGKSNLFDYSLIDWSPDFFANNDINEIKRIFNLKSFW